MQCDKCNGTGEVFDIRPGDVYVEKDPGGSFAEGAVFVVIKPLTLGRFEMMYGPNNQGTSTQPAWFVSDIEKKLFRVFRSRP